MILSSQKSAKASDSLANAVSEQQGSTKRQLGVKHRNTNLEMKTSQKAVFSGYFSQNSTKRFFARLRGHMNT